VIRPVRADEKCCRLDWSVDPRDWARPGVPGALRNIMHKQPPRIIKSWSTMRRHRSQTVEALRNVCSPGPLREGATTSNTV